MQTRLLIVSCQKSHFFGVQDALESTKFWRFSYLNGFSSQFVIIGLLAFVELTGKWVKEQREKRQLKTEKLTNELKLLKSQLSPHFLFNTLNNIDALIFQDQKLASVTVVKLSELLRYMLYDAALYKVKLSDEVEFIRNLLELQKLRLINKDDIDFRVEGNFERHEIAPMLLIPFVENMFKHGSQKGRSPLFSISIIVAQNSLLLNCKNHIRETKNIDSRSGIGLHNVKKRLELLYENNFSIQIINENNDFEIKLEIQLNALKIYT